MRDRQVHGGRAAAQRALADRERQAVHHPDERDHARGLAVLADLLADRAQIAPIGADAAALGGEPHVLVPQADDAFEAVGRLVEEARDRQPALGAAIGQHRRRRHEPHLADVVVDALRMPRVVAVVARHTGEQVLVAFARHKVAIIQRRPAEIRQKRIARPVNPDLMASLHLHSVEHGMVSWWHW